MRPLLTTPTFSHITMSQELTAKLLRTYEEVPYQSYPYAKTAPEHLEAVAHLFGVSAKPPAHARVLELGCASGGNLLPFAGRHRGAKAVGVDLSPVQVAQGRRAIAQAGITNVELHALNLEEITQDFGEFDYIICHGVYSWVPPSVQQAILRVASQNLAPKGLAYISYNTYPGWKAREIVRDAMLLHSEGRSTPAERLAHARSMVEFLHKMAPQGSVLHKTLDEAMPVVQGKQDTYLQHEFLEVCNAPCYFKDFVAAAQGHGLAYLADAEPTSMFVSNYGEAVAKPLLQECGHSQVKMEQYLDFHVNRQFRQSILVKEARAQEISYHVPDTRLRQFKYAGWFRGEAGLALDDAPESCLTWRDLSIVLRSRVQKALARVLNEAYPATCEVPALAAAVAQATGQTAVAVMPEILHLLDQLVVAGAVRYRRTPVRAPATVPDRPLATPVVRSAAQAQQGVPVDDKGVAGFVGNAWHDYMALDVLQRTVLPMLDGRQGEEELVAALLQETQAGRLQFLNQGQPITDAAQLQRSAREQLRAALQALRHKALLMVNQE